MEPHVTPAPPVLTKDDQCIEAGGPVKGEPGVVVEGLQRSSTGYATLAAWRQDGPKSLDSSIPCGPAALPLALPNPNVVNCTPKVLCKDGLATLWCLLVGNKCSLVALNTSSTPLFDCYINVRCCLLTPHVAFIVSDPHAW